MKEQANEVRTQVAGTISTLMTGHLDKLQHLHGTMLLKAIIATLIPKGNGITGLLIYAILYYHNSCCCYHSNITCSW
jgi:hypothetical protein